MIRPSGKNKFTMPAKLPKLAGNPCITIRIRTTDCPRRTQLSFERSRQIRIPGNRSGTSLGVFAVHKVYAWLWVYCWRTGHASGSTSSHCAHNSGRRSRRILDHLQLTGQEHHQDVLACTRFHVTPKIVVCTWNKIRLRRSGTGNGSDEDV